jgi:hypothetical protein
MNQLLRATAIAAALCATAVAQAAPISSEADPSLVGGTLVDFESGPTGNWVTQSFGALTVTATPGADTAAPTFSVDGDYAGQYNTRDRLHITNHGSEFQALRLDFGGPVSAFGFLFGASDSSWNLNAYSAGNVLLESQVIPPVFGSNAGDFFGFAGLAGASYATLTQNADGIYANGGVDYVFVDNVRTSAVAAIPEPETYALMIAGLGIVGAMARRRRAV